MHEKAATTARDIGARLQLQLDEYGLILDHLYGLEGRISSEKWISTMRRSGQGNRLRQHTNGSIGSALFCTGFVVQDVLTGWMKSEEIK